MVASGIRLVLFDCDGTLVDGRHAVLAAMASAFAGLGLPPPSDDAVGELAGVSLKQALRHLLPAATDETAAAAAAAFRAAYTAVRAGPDGGEPLFPGIAAALDRIEATGALLGVVTGMARRRLVDLLGRHGLAHRFVTLQSADDGAGKPAPDMVLRAMAVTGADAASTIVVGDTTFDIEMARNARVPAIGVAWGHHSPLLLKRAGADRIATMPAELPRLAAELLPEERDAPRL